MFPTSVARGLKQLRMLSVDNCGLVEIIAEEGLETVAEFVFPKVTSVVFRDLLKLRSFYPGMHSCRWPLLKDLKFVRCHNMEIFASGISSQEKLELGHIIAKDSFPTLENLTLGIDADVEISCGLLPAIFFSRLIYLVYYSAKSWPAAFLAKLVNLEKLELSGPTKEIFINERNTSAELHAVGILLPFKIPGAIRMPMLMHLGKQNSQSANPIFPNLKILDVWLCGKLKSLRSSAITFQNLATLKVARSHGLEYLITYSMAKSFVLLKNMEVKDCSRLMEIVAFSNDDDAGNDVSFSPLQHLELSDLPSLQRFCGSDCSVTLPSLDTLTITGCPVMLTISPEGMLLSHSKPERVKRKRKRKRKRNDYEDQTEGSDNTSSCQ